MVLPFKQGYGWGNCDQAGLIIHILDVLHGHFLNILFIYFRQRGREVEKHQCVVASHMPPTGDLALNPGMCPDWESNR